MRVDHIHFYVDDAKTQRDWMVARMGCQVINQASLGHSHVEVLRYHDVKFVLSSPLSDNSPIAEYLRAHAPGVADVALEVDNLCELVHRHSACMLSTHQHSCNDQARNKASSHYGDFSEHGEIISMVDSSTRNQWAKLAGWGGVSHTLVERQSIQGNSQNAKTDRSGNKPRHSRIHGIDHIVLNVPAGELFAASDFYRDFLGLQSQQKFKIKTKNSGLQSQVLADREDTFYLNINEPTSIDSQIQQFLDANHGAGIQHIALHSSPITTIVAELRKRGLPFLSVPDSYYQQVLEHLDQHAAALFSEAEWSSIRGQDILVDWAQEKPESVLLQIFSLPIYPGATFFFEFIERRGSVKGFGEKNFLALYEAIEAELQPDL
jgi:4-hydroxyphenylpyruvate dioxygenase